MIKTKKILSLAFSVGLIASMSISVFAAGYSSYKLPKFQGNNFTNTHVKSTDDRYIKNEVTAISNTSFANFWAADQNDSAQSSKYKQNVNGSPTKINFKSSSTLEKGDNVKMGMENASWSGSYGFVTGNVDFR